MRSYSAHTRGFTLIEMLVSVTIFSIVMVIALGSLLAMSESDRKAQTLKSVINNLNFSLDSMSRTIRIGNSYHCDIAQGTATAVRDCASISASSLAFRSSSGETVGYCLSGNAIRRAVTSGVLASSCADTSYSSITSPEVRINSLSFYVTGAETAGIQPKVIILISGVVTVTGTRSSTFNLQTSVTQRLYDQ